MKGEEITEPNLTGILSIIGADCECGLDVSWTQGTPLPIRWDEKLHAQAARCWASTRKARLSSSRPAGSWAGALPRPPGRQVIRPPCRGGQFSRPANPASEPFRKDNWRRAIARATGPAPRFFQSASVSRRLPLFMGGLAVHGLRGAAGPRAGGEQKPMAITSRNKSDLAVGRHPAVDPGGGHRDANQPAAGAEGQGRGSCRAGAPEVVCRVVGRPGWKAGSSRA